MLSLGKRVRDSRIGRGSRHPVEEDTTGLVGLKMVAGHGCEELAVWDLPETSFAGHPIDPRRRCCYRWVIVWRSPVPRIMVPEHRWVRRHIGLKMAARSQVYGEGRGL